MSDSTLPSFTGAMKSYFGFKQDQKASEFAKELKELTYQDKLDFHKMLCEAGHPCTPPVQPAS